jgi:hypothetical protein
MVISNVHGWIDGKPQLQVKQDVSHLSRTARLEVHKQGLEHLTKLFRVAARYKRSL